MNMKLQFYERARGGHPHKGDVAPFTPFPSGAAFNKNGIERTQNQPLEQVRKQGGCSAHLPAYNALRFNKLLNALGSCAEAAPQFKLIPGLDNAQPLLGVQRYTLNRNSKTSPSCTTYSLPSLRTSPFSLAAVIEPVSTRSL